jgi:hypothetical protein
VPVEDAVQHYLVYFTGISHEPEAELKSNIESYITSISGHGVVTEKNTGRTGTLIWRVDSRKNDR